MSDLNLPPETDSPDAGELPEAPPAAAKPAKPAKPAKAAKAPKAANPVNNTAQAVAEKRVRIVLEENDNIPPTGLYIGINGRSYLLRAGEEASVPASVVEVLNDAVEENPRTDGNGNVLDYRKKMRFPYRLLAD